MTSEKRLIDVNAFRKFWNNNYRHQYANETFLFALVNFPTVDAVEVVRCKDCKHWNEETGFCDVHSRSYGMYWDIFTEEDFCSYGERKDNGD